MAVICSPLMVSEKVRAAIYIEGFRESNPVRKEDFLLLKTEFQGIDLKPWR